MDLSHTQKVKILYKMILKLHRGLPHELQLLGNSYAKEEFKKHKKCNMDEAKIFMNEWSMYAAQLSKQLILKGSPTTKTLGSSLNINDLNEFRDDQIQQLYDLKLAATAEENKKLK